MVVQITPISFEYDLKALFSALYPEAMCVFYVNESELIEKDMDPSLLFVKWQLVADSEKVSVKYSENQWMIGEEAKNKGLGESVQRAKLLEDYPRFLAPNDEMKLKRLQKRLLKLLAYEIYLSRGGRPLPWGTLTGIRPTKILLDFCRHYGLKENEMAEEMRSLYGVSEEKIQLMIQVVAMEYPILQRNEEDEVSVYVGIPFCPTRCLYCSFTSYPIDQWQSQVKDYLNALEREIAMTYEACIGTSKIRTLYVGGGTPTSLNAQDLKYFMELLARQFSLSEIEEITVEAGRPDTITRDKLEILRSFGVKRISINPQTMNDDTLKRIGRHHTTQEIIDAYVLAKEVGFETINMDIIIGLVGEKKEDVINTLQEIRKLDPENLTVHTLALKRASRLKETESEYDFVTEDTVEEMLNLTFDAAKEMQMVPYYLYRQKQMVGQFENVGYTKKGHACTYNVEIMEEAQTIWAYGAGASTKVVFPHENRLERIENVKDVEHYIRRIDEMIQRKLEGANDSKANKQGKDI